MKYADHPLVVRSRDLREKSRRDRVVAANLRASVAFQHVDRAIGEIEDARADLSSVTSPSAPSSIGQMIRLLDDARAALKLAEHTLGHHSVEGGEDMGWTLDHDPSRAEKTTGHGRNHGCGKVGR